MGERTSDTKEREGRLEGEWKRFHAVVQEARAHAVGLFQVKAEQVERRVF